MTRMGKLKRALMGTGRFVIGALKLVWILGGLIFVRIYPMVWYFSIAIPIVWAYFWAHYLGDMEVD